ncbi:uncharacterized protein At4g15970-like isoform X1 [Vigna umbellata]|uniref:uncharacterized protein At4g15970-like isoform X1 n=1 Tax=Vigna umbellata TaxID=87088 RepID=UPI001F5F6AA3|nr:uncharacterized protein At4g15970-like isoform X1 [Vigna umbellata]
MKSKNASLAPPIQETTMEASVGAAVEKAAGEGMKAWDGGSNILVRRVMYVAMILGGVGVLWMSFYHFGSPLECPTFARYSMDESSQGDHDQRLESVLRRASMKDKTVILTTLNDAWAAPGSIFDLFLESFRIGNQTEYLLNHLVVITYEQKTQDRCLAVHKYCHNLMSKGDNFTGEQRYMTPNYLHMMWKRLEFLSSILDMGYSFVFTDCDIMWLRDPFKQFFKDADFQVACDGFNGNSSDIHNPTNAGFKYAKSNYRTIWFYKFWINSRSSNPKLNEQDVLDRIKGHPSISDMKLKMKFLSTTYFSGFCQVSKDFNKVTTMHANCCIGLEPKISDLKLVLEDWKKYMALSESNKTESHLSWRVPKRC